MCTGVKCIPPLSFKAGVAENITDDPLACIREAAETAKPDLVQEAQLCIVTPRGILEWADPLIKGLRQGLGEDFPIFGGCAGDQYRFKATYQFQNNKVFTDAVPFLLLSGPLLYSFGIESGWVPIGERAKVTEADKNTVSKIGDRSAVEFSGHYLGEGDLEFMREYPFAVFEDDSESFHLASARTYDAERGGIVFDSTIAEGAAVQIAHTSRDQIIEAAKKSVDSALTEYPGSKPSVAICFSCSARKEILGTRVEEEYQALKSEFPSLPIAGYYTYGEIGPLDKGKPCRFHNMTFVTLLIGTE